jgi:peptide/nickel transport system permease protein
MLRLIARKMVALVAVVLAVSFLTFFLINLLPGDPALLVLGPGGAQSPEVIEQVREDLHLNDPLPVRYAKWLGDALHGDLGRSYQSRQQVLDAIRERVPVTLELGVLAIVMAIVISIPLGVFSAYRANSIFDKGVTASSFGLLSIPNFMLGLFLIYLLAVRFDLLPATGWERLTADPMENLRRAIMPAVALGVPSIAVLTRLLRTDMIATLQEDHVMMARSKGLPTWHILFRHALRPSSFSLLTVAGLQVGALIGGTVVIEELFALPGVGRLLYQSILQRDYLVVQGVVLLLSVSFVVVNFVVDLLYSFLDPRIRLGESRVNA